MWYNTVQYVYCNSITQQAPGQDTVKWSDRSTSEGLSSHRVILIRIPHTTYGTVRCILYVCTIGCCYEYTVQNRTEQNTHIISYHIISAHLVSSHLWSTVQYSTVQYSSVELCLWHWYCAALRYVIVIQLQYWTRKYCTALPPTISSLITTGIESIVFEQFINHRIF
jgi:hypothetical protein